MVIDDLFIDAVVSCLGGRWLRGHEYTNDCAGRVVRMCDEVGLYNMENFRHLIFADW